MLIIRNPNFLVNYGDTLNFTGGADIDCPGNIEIYGTLGPDGSDGGGVRLRSQSGNIIIGGEVRASDGVFGPDVPVKPVVTGIAGTAGGGVTMICDQGSIEVLADGEVTAGNGGSGSDVNAAGEWPVTMVSATSGSGGDGGDILIEAPGLIVIAGKITAGEGGTGGIATAVGGSAGSTNPAGENGGSTGGGEEASPHQSEKGAIGGANAASPVPGQVEASARPGGRGGDIMIRLTPGFGSVSLEGTIHAGNGGWTEAATAEGGVRSSATVEQAARGGNVEVLLDMATSAAFVQNGGEVRGGNGGSCGNVGDRNPDYRAVASAVVDAVAWVGAPAIPPAGTAGGEPGGVSAQEMSTGTSVALKIQSQPADGGDSYGARAIGSGKTKRQLGARHQNHAPGLAVKIQAP